MVTQVGQTQRGGGIKLFIKEAAFFFLSVLIDFINFFPAAPIRHYYPLEYF